MFNLLQLCEDFICSKRCSKNTNALIPELIVKETVGNNSDKSESQDSVVAFCFSFVIRIKRAAKIISDSQLTKEILSSNWFGLLVPAF